MSINGGNDLTVEDIPKLLDEIKRLGDNEQEYRNTFRNIDALIESLRFDESYTDDLADEIIELISELERKVGEIT